MTKVSFRQRFRRLSSSPADGEASQEGGGLGNRRAAVYRVDSTVPRSRVCPLSVDGEARVCREVVPLWRAFLGGDGEAKASTTLGNNLCPPLLRPGGVQLQRRQRGPGDLRGRSGPAHLCLRQVMLLLACFCLDVVLFVDAVVGGWLDLALCFLGGGGRRRRAQIRELEKLGRGPSQWVIADNFIPFTRRV